jgi:hypothetical protein
MSFLKEKVPHVSPGHYLNQCIYIKDQRKDFASAANQLPINSVGLHHVLA